MQRLVERAVCGGGRGHAGYLAELEILAESADWGARAAALDALVDELEALATAAGVRGGCALDSDFIQVESPGWKPQWILEPAYSLPPLEHAASKCASAVMLQHAVQICPSGHATACPSHIRGRTPPAG